METLLISSMIGLWLMGLLNLLLTLRLVRWYREIERSREQVIEVEKLPDLTVGMPAPEFRARALTGEPVRLANYVGKSVLFLFVSPHCGGCRKKMPLLTRLSRLAKERAGVEFVLVSDSSSAQTYSWISSIRDEDKVEINFPVLVAMPGVSDFLMTYNPRGFIPYYCLVDEQGIVRSRDPLDMGEWTKLQREWEGPAASKTFLRNLRL